MLAIRAYAAADSGIWNKAVQASRNGSFLQRRDYMEYHADRFVDCSLIVENDRQVVAVFPATISDDVVTSHAGLTYAGLLMDRTLRAESTLAVFEQIGEYYRAQGVSRVIYKAVPHVFHDCPAEEDLYALHRLGARLVRRDLSSVIALGEKFTCTQGRRHDIGKAHRANIRWQRGGDLAAFHALLSQVLEKHGAVPTHALPELRLLQMRFPECIVLYEARVDDSLLAGVLVYDFGHVVHTQYMAVSEEGRRVGALSFLLAELIRQRYANRRYLSFGISTEQGGSILNSGLVAQKESFGARAVMHDFYEWVL